jgi:predicted esterase
MIKRVASGLLVVFIIAISAFVIWGSTPARPDTLALQELESNDVVNVEKGQFWLQFSPTNRDPISGFIFYPGGRVDYRAYAPLMRAIAERGYEVALVKMPLNLAVLGANRADAVIDANPEIPVWYIGGHSLGGAMAAAYVYNNPVSVQGLVLWAAYPAESNDLSQSGFPVLSIYAERDGLATPEKIQASIPLLPKDTMWVEIKGGNHAQFGSYGPQDGDFDASISAEEQHQLVVDATLNFLSRMQ